MKQEIDHRSRGIAEIRVKVKGHIFEQDVLHSKHDVSKSDN